MENTHGQKQGKVEAGEGSGDGWGWGQMGGKGRKLYLNNNKIQKYFLKN